MEDENKIIGIIGSGLIGRSWAMIFASAGYNVAIYDILEQQLIMAKEEIFTQLKSLESKMTLRGSLSAQQQFSRICYSNDLAGVVKCAFYIQECVPEQLELKRELYLEVDKLVDDQTIIASSTSTFMPSVLSKEIQHKSQFLVAHPVNPPYFVRLVEIVPAPWTKSDISQKVFDLMTTVGQIPIIMKKELQGFALNRIQYAILNECFNLVNDGYLDAENVDKVMTEGLGPRYAFLGPLETTHLNAEGFKNYSERYAETMYNVSQTFKPIPKLAGPTADLIHDQLCKNTPLSKLSERRTWRDESLIKLSQLKKNN